MYIVIVFHAGMTTKRGKKIHLFNAWKILLIKQINYL